MKRVYVIVSDRGGVKIGVSASPARRLVTLGQQQVGHFTLTYETEMRADSNAVEKLAHHLLADKKIRGEWFDVSAEDAQATIIKAIELIEGGDAPSRIPPKPKKRSEDATAADRMRRWRERKRAEGFIQVLLTIPESRKAEIERIAAEMRGDEPTTS
jgi:hypothetical protein